MYCSTLEALPRNGQLPTTGTHLQCSFRTSDDNNVDAALSSNQATNEALTYLAITGVAAKIWTSDLHEKFANLPHAFEPGRSRAASGFVLDSNAVDRWKQLEHLNVSE
jgi:hypothetical protein